MAGVDKSTGSGMIHSFSSLPAPLPPQIQVAGLIQRATGYFDQVVIEIRRMAAR
jgi:hypothetical protein